MITEIIKRNGRNEAFNQEKIVHAIFKAATACGGADYERAEEIGRQVVDVLQRHFRDKLARNKQDLKRLVWWSKKNLSFSFRGFEVG